MAFGEDRACPVRIEDQQDRGVVGGGRRRSPHPLAQGVMDLQVGQVVPRRQPGVTGDGAGPRAKTQQEALRCRQEDDGPSVRANPFRK
jgi:hypothetical protein